LTFETLYSEVQVSLLYSKNNNTSSESKQIMSLGGVAEMLYILCYCYSREHYTLQPDVNTVLLHYTNPSSYQLLFN